MDNNQIEKEILLKASVAQVWKALTDPAEFGQWFGVKMETPFAAGQTARGRITHPGYEHLTWEVKIVKMETEKTFSFTWHPYAIDPKVDYSQETPTLVEFILERKGSGTLLQLVESGFDKIPAERRFEAFRKTEGGWEQQMHNIAKHLLEA